MAALTYAQSGVDRKAGDELVDRIAPFVKKTQGRNVVRNVSGYASLYAQGKTRYLAASTDGVGTKLKLAFELNRHGTVGIDLVAMCVNDLLCVGAEPHFFLDYFATGKLHPEQAAQVIEGIAKGCLQAGAALVGGETAEMPGMYALGEYDLAGFAVGTVEAARVLPRKEIRAGDVLIGIGSSGCHSNGYSLLRRLWEQEGKDPFRGEELLTPTRIYVKSLLPLIQKKQLKGLAHITGSGFLNVPRMSEKVSYEIELPPAKELPGIYSWVRQAGGAEFSELAQTFNMGLGMVAAVSPGLSGKVLSALKKKGEKAWKVGRVISRKKGSPSQIFLKDHDGTQIELNY